jgi:signal transduction histidine kinase
MFTEPSNTFGRDDIACQAKSYEPFGMPVRHQLMETGLSVHVAKREPADNNLRPMDTSAELAELENRLKEEQRTKALLQSIVAGTRHLLDALDFEPALNNWLKMLADAQGAISASFFDVVTHPRSGNRTVRLLAEFSPFPPGVNGRQAFSFAAPFILDDFSLEEGFATLAVGSVFAFQATDLDGPVQQWMAEQGHATTILAPIMDGDTWIGAVSFDYWDRKDVNEQDEIILKTAADALASVLKRNDLQKRLVNEQKDRAYEQARLGDILQSVVRATRELVEEPDFEAGINRWLAILGDKTNAARASFYDTEGKQGGPDQNLRILAEWTRPGVTGSVTCSFDAPIVVPADHSTDFWKDVIRNIPHAVHTESFTGDLRKFLEEQGNKTVLIVPFLVAGRTHAVSFDFLVRQEFDDRTLAVLQTAANSIASEIERRNAERAKLEAERERAATAERAARDAARRAELLTAVVQSSDDFLRATSVAEAGDVVVRRIGEALSLDRCAIGSLEPPDGRSKLGWYVIRHEWASRSANRQMDDPELAALDMANYEEFLETLRSGAPIALLTTDIDDPDARGEQEKSGAQSQFHYPVMVDGELWGSFGCDDCTSPRQFNEWEVATLRLVASAIGSLLKRERLLASQVDTQRAVAEERARIAREIHDTLAQAFTGIILQGEAARAQGMQNATAPVVYLKRATDLAKFGLSEARRSVLALRPLVLEQKGLQEALVDLAARTSVPGFMSVDFHDQKLVHRLYANVEDLMFRVAQEGLTNAMRHSGALNVSISLTSDDAGICLCVSDNGRGFDSSTIGTSGSGTGLSSLRARLETMNGSLVVTSSSDEGTTLQARLPSQPMPLTKRKDF